MMRAILLLLLLVLWVSPIQAQPYDRSQWEHWVDEDQDCQDTRQEVLIRDAIGPVTLSEDGCRVVGGTWIDPYTGKTFTDPRKLDIDHVAPLAEVHRSGGVGWSLARKRAYANWMPGLIAVDRRANRSKGAKDPARWMPPLYHCWYVSVWIHIKEYWDLTMDTEEQAAVVKGCHGNRQ